MTELEAASRAADRYIREHGYNGDGGPGLVYLGDSAEWRAIKARLAAALWPAADIAPGAQLALLEVS